MMTAITLVAGASGVGKTTWIQQQLATMTDSAVYMSLGSETVPVDATYLTTEFPKLTVLSATQLGEFLQSSAAQFYIEVGFHLDLTTLVLPVQMQNYRRIAVVSPEITQTEWHDWADVLVTGIASNISLSVPHLWRSVLTRQILDPASLNTFWYELTHHAYGKIQRAKGIFDLADGRAFYFNFVSGLPESNYLEVKVPHCLEGRSTGFSGIEVVGEDLDPATIAETLKDCCLDDQAIAYYQQQIKESLGQQEEEVA